MRFFVGVPFLLLLVLVFSGITTSMANADSKENHPNTDLEILPPSTWVGVVLRDTQYHEKTVPLVIGTEKNGPAEIAGLTTGDIILAIDSVAVSTLKDVRDIIASKEIGAHVLIEIVRENRISNIQVQTKTMPYGVRAMVEASKYAAKKDIEQSIYWLREAARSGNENAQNDLGFKYREGVGVERDYVEALRWFNKSATNGNLLGQHNIGLMYFNGFGVEKDSLIAKEWIEKAAKSGLPDSQFILGQFYRYGEGGIQSYEISFEWMFRAANNGHLGAQYALGWFYGQGKGVGQSSEEQVKWWKKAASLGNVDAQVQLGWNYKYGVGVERSIESAKLWWEKAANQSDKRGAKYLAGVYAFDVDYIQAKDWYKKAELWGDDGVGDKIKLIDKRTYEAHLILSKLGYAGDNLIAKFQRDYGLLENGKLNHHVYESIKAAVPFLKIENGLHIGQITDSDIDNSGKVLVTAAVDKTVRIWDVESNRSLHVLHIPTSTHRVEADNLRVAISPDASTVAIGGKTGLSWHNGYSVYIVDAESGEIVTTVSGLRGSTIDLAFSSDGKRLAIASAYHINVLDTGDWSYLVKDYSNAMKSVASAIDFSVVGHMLVAAKDGSLNIYDDTYKIVSNYTPVGVTKLMSAKFSPSGDKIAISYSSPRIVKILNSTNFKLINTFEFDEYAGIENVLGGGGVGRNLISLLGSVYSLSWSLDGQSLYGYGALFNGDGETIVRKWTDINYIKFTQEDIPFSSFGYHDSTVRNLHVLPSGKLLIAGKEVEQEFTSSSKDIRQIITQKSTPFNTIKLVRVSSDATHVIVENAVNKEDGGNFYFSLNKLSLINEINSHVSDVEPYASLAAYIDLDTTFDASGFKINKNTTGLLSNIKMPDGFLGSSLHIGDKKIDFGKTDVISSVAASHDNSHLYISTVRGYLNSYDRLLSLGWSVKLPALVQGIGVSSGGIIVTVSYDGFVRWHSPEDGSVALSLFIDGKEWVAYTSDGYFVSSNRGDSMVGWHINYKKDTLGDFVEVGQLHQRFYRPDKILTGISNKLKERSVSDDMAYVFNSRLIPSVRLTTQSKTTDQRDLLLEYSVCDEGGGIGKKVLRINESRINIGEGTRGIKVINKIMPTTNAQKCFSGEHLISLLPGLNKIRMTAYNKENTVESIGSEIEMNYTGLSRRKPDLHIFAVAIDKYRDIDLRLKYSKNDAEALIESLSARANPLFNKIRTYKLYDDEVRASKLSEKFFDIGEGISPEDVFVLYLAGHGITSKEDGDYYFLPVDFRYTSDASVKQHALSNGFLLDGLSNIAAQKTLVLLDTCNSGSFSDIRTRGVEEKTAVSRLVRATGRATIMASSKTQVALEGYQDHGVFTWTLLEALSGKGYGDDNQITVNELADYIEETLPELTYRKFGYEQIPQRSLQGMNFPLGIN